MQNIVTHCMNRTAVPLLHREGIQIVKILVVSVTKRDGNRQFCDLIQQSVFCSIIQHDISEISADQKQCILF